MTGPILTILATLLFAVALRASLRRDQGRAPEPVVAWPVVAFAVIVLVVLGAYVWFWYAIDSSNRGWGGFSQ